MNIAYEILKSFKSSINYQEKYNTKGKIKQKFYFDNTFTVKERKKEF